MKFDVCITNPPYGNIDLKILKKVIPHCKQTICIHPTRWLLSKKPNLDKASREYKEMIDGYVKSVEIFNGNPIFGIKSFIPVGIFDIRSRKQKEINVIYFGDRYMVKSLDDITVYGKEWSIVKPLFKKVRKYCSKGMNLKEQIHDDKEYKVYVPNITGDKNVKDIMVMYGNSFYSLASNNPEKQSKGQQVFSFDTEEERDNFIKYIKTDFARFCLSFYKNNPALHRGELAIIPWLDFTKEWTDKELYEKFNVSEELQNYITTFLPDYHGVRG